MWFLFFVLVQFLYRFNFFNSSFYSPDLYKKSLPNLHLEGFNILKCLNFKVYALPKTIDELWPPKPKELDIA